MCSKRKNIKVGLLTVEESNPTKEDADEMKQAIESNPTETAEFTVVATRLDVPNSEPLITSKLNMLIRDHCNVIFVIGGISSDNDAAIESVDQITEFKYTDLQHELSNFSNNAICGLKDETIIINLPSGFPDAFRCFTAIKEGVARAITEMRDISPEEIASRSLLYDIGGNEFCILDADESHLESISLETARRFISDILFDLGSEKIQLEDCLHRIAAEDISTGPELGYPLRDLALVDGLASDSAHCAGLRIVQAFDGRVMKEHVVPVSAGAGIPEGAVAVTQMEDTCFQDITPDGELRVMLNTIPKYAGENIRWKGKEIFEDRILVPSFTRMTASLITSCAGIGKRYIHGLRKPSIGILTLGNNLQDYVDEPKLDDTLHLSKLVLINFLKRYHYEATDYGTVRNRFHLIKRRLDQERLRRKPDVIITIGGNFNGRFTEMEDVLHSYKAKILFSNVRISLGYFLKAVQGSFTRSYNGRSAGYIVQHMDIEKLVIRSIADSFEGESSSGVKYKSTQSLYNKGQTDRVIPVHVTPGPGTELWACPARADKRSARINILSESNGYTILAPEGSKAMFAEIDVTLFDDIGSSKYKSVNW